jgi:hypothetical protein
MAPGFFEVNVYSCEEFESDCVVRMSVTTVKENGFPKSSRPYERRIAAAARSGTIVTSTSKFNARLPCDSLREVKRSTLPRPLSRFLSRPVGVQANGTVLLRHSSCQAHPQGHVRMHQTYRLNGVGKPGTCSTWDGNLIKLDRIHWTKHRMWAS